MDSPFPFDPGSPDSPIQTFELIIMLKTSLSLISVAVLLAASAADAAVTVTAAPAVTAPAAADTAALRQKTLPLSAMVPGGGDHPIRLTGSEPAS